MSAMNRRLFLGSAAAAMTMGSVVRPSRAATYDSGASDKEIRIGQFGPLSGPVAAWGAVAAAMNAYYGMINEKGGINGRQIKFIYYDDGYSPPKSVEAARKLVEGDEVLIISGPMGTPGNTAIQKYMNARKVPQLFVVGAAAKLSDPTNNPWTMVSGTLYEHEGEIAARYVSKEFAKAKIAILYQNDDAGKALLSGFKAGLSNGPQIVSELTYLPADPTIDSQMVRMKTSGADFIYLVTVPKMAVQALTKPGAMNWRPQILLSSGNASVRNSIRPAGYENAQGALALGTRQDLGNPAWSDTPDMKAYMAFLDKYAPNVDRIDEIYAIGYTVADTTRYVLEQCGDVLTRENVMKQAASLKSYSAPLLLPGITLNTSPTDYVPVKQYQMLKFQGERYERVGGLLTL